jgi:RND family efflux transporter MFP subunit
VEEILVQPGDRVAVGTTLAILDKADQQLALSEAQARYAQQRSELAKLEVGTRPEIIAQRQAAVTTAIAREKAAQDNLQRTLNLIREGAVAQRLVVEAQAAVDAARGTRLAAQAELTEAQAGPIREEIAAQQATVQAAAVAVNQARLSLNRTQVVASSVGVVQSRAVSQGDLVQSGGAIATLIAGDRLDIFLEVPENLTGQVTPGTPVQLTTRSLPNWKGRTTITATAPSTETASRRQRVRIQLNSPPAGLLPGMAISATITQPINRFGFLVSRDALTRRRDQWLVFAVDNDKAKQVQVEMVADMGKQVLISTPDLKAGQAIVSRGSDLLQDNSPIKVVKPQG